MPLVHIGEKQVYFVHCPKAGGSSVEDYLETHFNDIELLERDWLHHWTQTGGQYRQSSLQHMTWADARSHLPAPPDRTFAVVRHPVSRLVSEFHYQKANKSFKWLRYRLGWMPFSTWLRVMVLASRIAPHIHDNHFRPQVDLMPATDVDIFKLEDGLEAVAQYLAELGGPDGETMPKSLVSKDKGEVHVSRQDLLLISRRYRKDFERFGYARPDRAALRRAPGDPRAVFRSAFALVAAPLLCFKYARGKV